MRSAEVILDISDKTLRLPESRMRRKSLMSGSEGGCWKSGTLRAQLAGFLPYVKYGFEGKTEGVTSPSHPTLFRFVSPWGKRIRAKRAEDLGCFQPEGRNSKPRVSTPCWKWESYAGSHS